MQVKFPQSREAWNNDVERRLNRLRADFAMLWRLMPQTPEWPGIPMSGPLSPLPFEWFPPINTGGTNTGGTPGTRATGGTGGATTCGRYARSYEFVMGAISGTQSAKVQWNATSVEGRIGTLTRDSSTACTMAGLLSFASGSQNVAHSLTGNINVTLRTVSFGIPFIDYGTATTRFANYSGTLNENDVTAVVSNTNAALFTSQTGLTAPPTLQLTAIN